MFHFSMHLSFFKVLAKVVNMFCKNALISYADFVVMINYIRLLSVMINAVLEHIPFEHFE